MITNYEALDTLRFAMSEVALVVEHPNERAHTVLSDEAKRSLLGDLA